MRVPYTTGILQFIISVFIPHIFVVSTSSSSYLERFLAVFSEVLRSDNTATSMSLRGFFLMVFVLYIGYYFSILFLFLFLFLFFFLSLLLLVMVIGLSGVQFRE